MQPRFNTRAIAASLTGAIGLWLVLSPLVITISDAAAYSQIAAGTILLAASLGGMAIRNGLIMLAVALAGIWLNLSVIFFTADEPAQWNLLTSGLLVLLIVALDAFSLRRRLHI